MKKSEKINKPGAAGPYISMSVIVGTIKSFKYSLRGKKERRTDKERERE